MLCMAEVHKEICHAEHDVHFAGDSAKCRIELEQPNPKEVLKSNGFDAFFIINQEGLRICFCRNLSTSLCNMYIDISINIC